MPLRLNTDGHFIAGGDRERGGLSGVVIQRVDEFLHRLKARNSRIRKCLFERSPTSVTQTLRLLWRHARFRRLYCIARSEHAVPRNKAV